MDNFNLFPQLECNENNNHPLIKNNKIMLNSNNTVYNFNLSYLEPSPNKMVLPLYSYSSLEVLDTEIAYPIFLLVMKNVLLDQIDFQMFHFDLTRAIKHIKKNNILEDDQDEVIEEEDNDLPPVQEKEKEECFILLYSTYMHRCETEDLIGRNIVFRYKERLFYYSYNRNNNEEDNIVEDTIKINNLKDIYNN